MARTRTVFGSHSNLAHVWAQQSYEAGKASDRRMFFEGAKLYSYGYHYVIARFTDTNEDGRQIVLFNGDSRSVSTGKHRSHAREALRGLHVCVWEVDDPEADSEAAHARNLAGMVTRFNEAHAKYVKPFASSYYSMEDRLKGMAEAMNNMQRYGDAFGVAVPDFGYEAKCEELRAAFAKFNDPKAVAKRERAKARRAHKASLAVASEALKALAAHGELTHDQKREDIGAAVQAWLAEGYALEAIQPLVTYVQQQRAIIEQNATVRVLYPHADAIVRERQYRSWSSRKTVKPEDWINGAGNISDCEYDYSSATLVRRMGDRLETSRGAQVPFAHSVAVFLKAQECRKAGKAWQRNGETVRVGTFQLDRIDVHGNIVAGCHTIAFEEMQRLAIREVPHMVKALYPVPALIAA